MLTLAVNCTENYLVHLDSLLWSVVVSEGKPFKVYLLHDGIEPGVLHLFETKWERFQVVVIEVDVSSSIGDFQPNSNFPPICFGRLLIPRLLAHEQRVLYLDIDIIVLKPLLPLYQVDLAGFPIAGVLDSGTGRGISRIKNVLSPKVINAGVILMDLTNDLCREKFDTAVQIGSSQYLKYADQDSINRAFRGGIMVIDDQWNWQKLAYRSDASVIHFAHGNPWVEGCKNENLRFYEKTNAGLNGKI